MHQATKSRGAIKPITTVKKQSKPIQITSRNKNIQKSKLQQNATRTIVTKKPPSTTIANTKSSSSSSTISTSPSQLPTTSSQSSTFITASQQQKTPSQTNHQIVIDNINPQVKTQFSRNHFGRLYRSRHSPSFKSTTIPRPFSTNITPKQPDNDDDPDKKANTSSTPSSSDSTPQPSSTNDKSSTQGDKSANNAPVDDDGQKEKKKKEKEKEKEKKKEKNFEWTSMPKLQSLKKLTPGGGDDDPDARILIAFRLLAVFVAAEMIVPLVTEAKRYKSRLANTYQGILDSYLSQNQVHNVASHGKTITFHLTNDSKNPHSLDVLSLPDFAARLAFDAHRFGLNLPVIQGIEQEPLGIATGLILLQVIFFMGFLGKSSSLLPNREGPKIKKVEGLTTRFTDVAGMDEAKAEIVEFVDFLKEPEKYKKLGARLPKGALLSGPPGTGKTLLAKATAGEAAVSFYSVSASEFQQMYVGMGAKRVRDLFKTARKNAPAIIFIDEIDSIAKQRSSRGNESSSEREATLNQLLVEMDGFNTQEAVVVFAATNRAELLDAAVTRAGRFDRKIQVDTPDLNGREQIFNVHLKKLNLAHPQSDVAKKISALTPGMVGADIANVCNEAAIGAARRDNSTVELVDFETAVDKVVGGLERKQDMNNQKQREVVAYHEAGHALLGWFLEHTDPLLKVTIIPRTNGALGFAQYLPKETGLQQTEHLRDMIAMALGGRAAEDLVYNTVSTGASDDLRQVARITQGMILRYGMSKQFTNTAFATLDDDRQVWKSMSQKTNFAIDKEIMGIVGEEYERAKKLLSDKRDLLESLGKELLLKETLNHEQLVAILGERPFKSDHYVSYVQSRKEFDQDLKKEKESHENNEPVNAV